MKNPVLLVALITSLTANALLGVGIYRLGQKYVDGVSCLYDALIFSMHRHQTVVEAIRDHDLAAVEKQTALLLYSDLDIYRSVTNCVPVEIQGRIAATATHSAWLLKKPKFYRHLESMNLKVDSMFDAPAAISNAHPKEGVSRSSPDELGMLSYVGNAPSTNSPLSQPVDSPKQPEKK